MWPYRNGVVDKAYVVVAPPPEEAFRGEPHAMHHSRRSFLSARVSKGNNGTGRGCIPRRASLPQGCVSLCEYISWYDDEDYDDYEDQYGGLPSCKTHYVESFLTTDLFFTVVFFFLTRMFFKIALSVVLKTLLLRRLRARGVEVEGRCIGKEIHISAGTRRYGGKR